MTHKNTRNAGFTLVELSIVLVIIGLIIGGVLSGRQIMLNAQVTNAINSIQAYEAQFQTYVQNYGVMPGDDANAAARFGSVAISVTSSTGTLSGAFDSATASDGSRILWSDLRGAGLVKNQSGTDSTVQPANPFGGIYGFQHGAFTGSTTFSTNVICLNNVPGDAAAAIDSRLDDGSSNAGSIMSMVSTGAAGEAYGAGSVPTTATYDSTKTYTMCAKM